MEQMGGGDMSKVCNCPHHKVVPFAIMLIGLVLILEAFSIFTGMWPTVIIGAMLVVIGVVKLKGRNCKCCQK